MFGLHVLFFPVVNKAECGMIRLPEDRCHVMLSGTSQVMIGDWQLDTELVGGPCISAVAAGVQVGHVLGPLWTNDDLLVSQEFSEIKVVLLNYSRLCCSIHLEISTRYFASL